MQFFSSDKRLQEIFFQNHPPPPPPPQELNGRPLTRKELCRFKIKEGDNCIYCGEADSIDHSFINCQFTRSFYQKVLQWFNATHNSTFSLTTEEFLFGILTAFTTLLKKINYAIMFLRYYIYKRNLQNYSLLLPDFINKIIYKYKIEKLIL